MNTNIDNKIRSLHFLLPTNIMSEKLCLQWNEFQENAKGAFRKLGEDKNFTDVTLACEDGQQFEAHKVILVASSPFFKKFLEMNKHPHPLIYMRGLKSEDLQAIIDFLYCGEANVFQENLDSFLSIAEELQLNGLMGNSDGGEQKPEADVQNGPKVTKSSMGNVSQTQECVKQSYPVIKPETNSVVAVSTIFIENLEELEEKVNSMMEKSENNYGNGQRKADRCKVCGKEGMGKNIKDHIEANHLEGVVLPCSQCEKTFRCRNTLKWHVRKYHQTEYNAMSE